LQGGLLAQAQNVPQHVLHSTSLFIPYALEKCCSPFHLYNQAKINLSILGTIVSFFAVMGQSNWLVAKNKKTELGRALGRDLI
jgi:hypothetical protein